MKIFYFFLLANNRFLFIFTSDQCKSMYVRGIQIFKNLKIIYYV